MTLKGKISSATKLKKVFKYLGRVWFVIQMFQCLEQKNLCVDRKRGLTWNIKMPRSTSRRTSEKNARARGKHHVRKPHITTSDYGIKTHARL